MPKYFCEYCGIYLTHSSPGGRYQHSHGRKHINNKIEYYSQFLYEFQQNTYENLLTMAAKISQPQSSHQVITFESNDGLLPSQSLQNDIQHSLVSSLENGLYQPPIETIPEKDETNDEAMN